MVARFLDRSFPPDRATVLAVIGASVARWDAVRDAIALAHAPVAETWAWSGSKAGWSLRLARLGRPIVYLTPLEGGCRGSLAIPERALERARIELTPETFALVDAAPRYPEGRAVRLVLGTDGDVEALVALAAVRMRADARA